jgi:hypothetical protein
MEEPSALGFNQHHLTNFKGINTEDYFFNTIHEMIIATDDLISTQIIPLTSALFKFLAWQVFSLNYNLSMYRSRLATLRRFQLDLTRQRSLRDCSRQEVLETLTHKTKNIWDMEYYMIAEKPRNNRAQP